VTVNWEVFTIIGTVIAILTFWLTFFRKPDTKEEMEALTVSFMSNQTLSQRIITDLYNLANEANGWQAEFSPGVTYQVAYEMLVTNHENTLSDRSLENIKTLKLTTSLIASMQKSLDNQFIELQKIEMGIMAARKTWEFLNRKH
jgi:hypothetical protein